MRPVNTPFSASSRHQHWLATWCVIILNRLMQCNDILEEQTSEPHAWPNWAAQLNNLEFFRKVWRMRRRGETRGDAVKESGFEWKRGRRSPFADRWRKSKPDINHSLKRISESWDFRQNEWGGSEENKKQIPTQTRSASTLGKKKKLSGKWGFIHVDLLSHKAGSNVSRLPVPSATAPRGWEPHLQKRPILIHRASFATDR